MKFKKITQLLENQNNAVELSIKEDVFEDDWQDDFIVGRDEEIKQLVGLIVNFIRGNRFFGIVEGSTGSGKSFILRSVIRALKEKNIDDLPQFFYTKSTARTPSMFKSDLYKMYGLKRNATSDELHKKIKHGLVIILDIVSRHDITRYLNRTILPIIDTPKISFFMISSDGNVVHKFYTLHNQTMVSITHIKMVDYKENEIMEILKHRVEAAISKDYSNRIGNMIYRYIANKVITDYGGNVRAGIKVIKHCIYQIEHEGEVTLPMIDTVLKDIGKNHVIKILKKFNWSNDHVILFFKSLIHATSYMKQRDLYNLYSELCENRGKTIHSYVWYGNNLRDLHHLEFLDLTKRGQIGSVMNHVKLNVDATIIQHFLSNYTVVNGE